MTNRFKADATGLAFVSGRYLLPARKKVSRPSENGINSSVFERSRNEPFKSYV
jgi:hypothetical protein